jgi:Skp family chaperone for outer membrane proteins
MSTKSLIERLRDDIKQCDEELDNEFSKQVKNPKKQEELLDKRHKYATELFKEWDKQHNDHIQVDEDSPDPFIESLLESIEEVFSMYRKQVKKLEKKVAKLEKALASKK